MQADGELDVLDVLRLLPVHEVAEIVDEVGLLKVAALGQEVQVVGVAQALNKLQLDLVKKML